MLNTEIRRNSHKKVAALGVLSLVALSQFGLATQSAQAKRSDDTWRGNNPTELRRSNRQRVTMRGWVEDDKRGRNAFVLRGNDNRTYIVDTRNSNEPNLDRGDVVEVSGRLVGAQIRASDVRVIDRGNDSSRDRRGRRRR